MPNIAETYRGHKWMITSLVGRTDIPAVCVYAKSVEIPPATSYGGDPRSPLVMHFYDVVLDDKSDMLSNLLDLRNLEGLTQVERVRGQDDEGIGNRQIHNRSGWMFHRSSILEVVPSKLDYTSLEICTVTLRLRYERAEYKSVIESLGY